LSLKDKKMGSILPNIRDKRSFSGTKWKKNLDGEVCKTSESLNRCYIPRRAEI